MRIIGHRGARGLAPENTIASLLKAIEHGVDEIEFDVRVTSDGIVVVHHDTHLVDQAGNHLLLAHNTYEELRAHKADLPTLEQALMAINRQVPALIEVKPDVDTKPIIKIIKSFLKKGWQPKDILVGSFKHATLRELHAALPEIQMVVIERWSGMRAVWRARELGTKRLNMNQRWLWRGFIAPMRRRGWELYPYTLNDKAKASRWANYGIAGIITDYPDRFEK